MLSHQDLQSYFSSIPANVHTRKSIAVKNRFLAFTTRKIGSTFRRRLSDNHDRHDR
jgi:hypothetical protein